MILPYFDRLFVCVLVINNDIVSNALLHFYAHLCYLYLIHIFTSYSFPILHSCICCVLFHLFFIFPFSLHNFLLLYLLIILFIVEFVVFEYHFILLIIKLFVVFKYYFPFNYYLFSFIVSMFCSLLMLLPTPRTIQLKHVITHITPSHLAIPQLFLLHFTP